MTRLAFATVMAVALVAAACGGSGEPPPQPLKYHLDEAYIASVPMDQKNAMLQAQNEYQRAKAEKMKAEADLGDAGTQLDVARNELKQAKLDRDSASSRKKAADDSGDFTRINAGKRDQRVADLAVRAAEQKVDALEAKRSWLKKLIRYTAENTFAAEARYELAKATLARSNNISPKGFAFQAYVDQKEDRSRKAQRAKLIADRERDHWQSEQKEWQARKAEADHAKGVDTATTSK